MRATDVIRDLLNIIDSLETKLDDEASVVDIIEPSAQIQTGVDSNRFKHILAMLDFERANPSEYANSPKEFIASVDSVTCDAGGGWNGPKNPADLRGNSLSLYPENQHRLE